MKNEILDFIKDCILNRRILWTYHINIRLIGRSISREDILSSLNSYEIIEEYPHDKYLPSYLIYAKLNEKIIHILIAANVKEKNVTIITAYMPTFEKWEDDFKRRRKE